MWYQNYIHKQNVVFYGIKTIFTKKFKSQQKLFYILMRNITCSIIFLYIIAVTTHMALVCNDILISQILTLYRCGIICTVTKQIHAKVKSKYHQSVSISYRFVQGMGCKRRLQYFHLSSKKFSPQFCRRMVVYINEK